MGIVAEQGPVGSPAHDSRWRGCRAWNEAAGPGPGWIDCRMRPAMADGPEPADVRRPPMLGSGCGRPPGPGRFRPPAVGWAPRHLHSPGRLLGPGHLQGSGCLLGPGHLQGFGGLQSRGDRKPARGLRLADPAERAPVQPCGEIAGFPAVPSEPSGEFRTPARTACRTTEVQVSAPAGRAGSARGHTALPSEHPARTRALGLPEVLLPHILQERGVLRPDRGAPGAHPAGNAGIVMLAAGSVRLVGVAAGPVAAAMVAAGAAVAPMRSLGLVPVLPEPTSSDGTSFATKSGGRNRSSR